jgi:hypothetical protein
MSDQEKRIAVDLGLVTCDGCGKPIDGAYATLGGNWVPFIAPKAYHLGCLPSLRSVDPDPTFVHGSLTDAKFECTPKSRLRTTSQCALTVKYPSRKRRGLLRD